MLKLIVGVKGSGKTKTLLDQVNEASEKTAGCVVCIEHGTKLTYGVRYTVRLIDTKSYDVENSEQLYGMVCGVYATNYDVTHLFIDSALKICNNSMDDFAAFVRKIDKLVEKNNLTCVMTASADPSELPEDIRKFI
ncbi:MAG: ATP-binding protein [Eubacteriales bacterium]